MSYLLIKSLHLISVISWMAGILYLYRLLVYHAEETEELVKSRFRVMEHRLYKYITFPAMVASFVFGILMLVMNPLLLHFGWMHAKLGCVILLAAATLYADFARRRLADGTWRHGSKVFRFLNEVPTLLMIAIVIFVIMRPF